MHRNSLLKSVIGENKEKAISDGKTSKKAY